MLGSRTGCTARDRRFTALDWDTTALDLHDTVALGEARPVGAHANHAIDGESCVVLDHRWFTMSMVFCVSSLVGLPQAARKDAFFGS